MTKKKIDWNTFEAFVQEFRDESDRAAVILGAAKLDSMLYQLLDRFLLPSLASTDELLEGDSPLATFSARINAAYRLGLISSNFAKSLHLVRRIRNAFAHETTGCNLSTGPHAQRVNALLLQLRSLPFFYRFREHFFPGEKSLSVDFRACLAMMAARLEARLHDISPIDGSKAWNFTKESWADDDVSNADEPNENDPKALKKP